MARPNRSSSRRESRSGFNNLTPVMAWRLAAPHTWPAAILPVLLAIALAARDTGSVSFLKAFVLLLICVLMQAAVNTFNDYFDYVKGTDSVDDYLEESDAVLLYNNVNPRHALALAIGFLVVAFLLGLYIIQQAGFFPLIIGVIGGVIVILYSGGRTPISYLPIGEVVSGVVMGGLIPLACYQVLTGTISFMPLLMSIPIIIGIGLIMMTNNTCDIEKDMDAYRDTLSVRLGRPLARRYYRIAILVWIAVIVLLLALFQRGGLLLVPCMILALFPFLQALFKNPLESYTRVPAMTQILSVNVALNTFYVAGILAGGIAIL